VAKVVEGLAGYLRTRPASNSDTLVHFRPWF